MVGGGFVKMERDRVFCFRGKGVGGGGLIT